MLTKISMGDLVRIVLVVADDHALAILDRHSEKYWTTKFEGHDHSDATTIESEQKLLDLENTKSTSPSSHAIDSFKHKLSFPSTKIAKLKIKLAK